MPEPRRPDEPRLVDVDYAPQVHHRALPVEVLDRASVLARRSDRTRDHRQRVGFHILMICTAGAGTHVVDFEPIATAPGTCVRIRPGQVQRFVLEPAFDAHLVVWPAHVQDGDPSVPSWYPGCGAATSWQLVDEVLATVLRTVDDLRTEQDRFDGSPQRGALLRSLLHTLELRLAIAAPDSVPSDAQVPEAYLRLRRRLEERLHERPSVIALARDLGYSTRTLDRACQQATGRTAKQVIDERVALEVRRLLTHTDRPVASVGSDLGFDDPSNFTKFVKRHLGVPPTQLRDEAG